MSSTEPHVPTEPIPESDNSATDPNKPNEVPTGDAVNQSDTTSGGAPEEPDK